MREELQPGEHVERVRVGADEAHVEDDRIARLGTNRQARLLSLSGHGPPRVRELIGRQPIG
jgi:hypothetical protein